MTQRQIDEEKYLILTEIDKRNCEKSLEAFTRSAWHIIEPGTKLSWNWHFDVICEYLQAVQDGRINRLIINVPPGTAKSTLVSVMFPAWLWIKDPTKRYLNITNEQGLALRDALKAKTIITSGWYQQKWPLLLDASQNEKILYQNEKRGFRQSLGVTAGITGKRGNLLILDDLSDSTGIESDAQRQTVLDAYDYKISTRLNDPKHDAIILIMQRLHHQDLTGHLLSKKRTKWTHLSIPMEYEGESGYDGVDIGRPELTDPRTKDGELMFPARFDRKTVNALKEDLGIYGTSGQLQQRPSPKGGGIIKVDWWRKWPDDQSLPKCEHIFASWDTAYTEKDLKSNSYSAMTMWGVFWNNELKVPRYCLLLIKAWTGQVGYPDLRARMKKIAKNDKPDCQLIEKKASGLSLVQDARQAGIFVRTYTPDRDKTARAYSVSAMFESGQVYVPNRRWADKVIDWVSQFPNGSSPSSDITDTVTQALLYLRNNWWVTHPDDHLNNDINKDPNVRRNDDYDEWDDDIKPERVNSAYG